MENRITYNKLVRDRIPEIIEKNGGACTIRKLDDDEFLKAIDAKLDEELAEYHAAEGDDCLWELADLCDLIYAAAEARGCDKNMLDWIRVDKRERRGGFKKKIFLVDATEQKGG